MDRSRHPECVPRLSHDNIQLPEPNRAVPNVSPSPASAAFTMLPSGVTDYVLAALADNTRRAYQSDLRHFLGWGGSLPASEGTVAQYLAHFAGSLSTATLARRLVAIVKAHTMQGLPSPTRSELVRLTMRGIYRKHGRPQRRVAAAVKEDILVMVSALGTSLRDRRDRALLLLGFAGAFRRSELVAINCNDIERGPAGIIVTIRRSKTDQEGHGRRVAIPYAQGPACPVRALEAWLSASGICEGSIFRAVNRHGQIHAKALSGEAVALIVKERARAAGLDAKRYAGHSLRAGLVTSAAAAGVQSWKIREQTGHASDVTLQRYIRDGELFVNNAVGSLL